jgi:hypothetical protein
VSFWPTPAMIFDLVQNGFILFGGSPIFRFRVGTR